ncbi:MAG: hypothetical protein J7598_00545 [Mitsuaria chitosanitabida]|uniref:hypothetical protein n=1 Tax=Roseateles chitosanitabidus TaxID=65048 RepID=UPI001B0F07CD|nr:hypothetical protein [Roseateles chitosanitabidus]MBO9685073.1 hypothetical protein [Roseateles chitosanitabidus]
MRGLHVCLWPMAAALLLATAPARAERSGDPLAPIADCVGKGELKVLAHNRLPESVQSRTVATAQGEQRVSMADGYRVLLATPQGLPFVNFKVELSDPASAEADRAAILGQMQVIAQRSTAPGGNELQREHLGDAELLALHQKDLSRGGPLSFYSIFIPARHLVSTIYVLNQDPAKRAFATFDDYARQRDAAIAAALRCLG